MPTETFEAEYHKLTRLLELTEMLGQQSDFDEILRVVTHQAASLLRAETGLIMMINPRTHNTIKTIFKGGQETDQRYQALHAQVCGWVIKNNRALLSQNIQDDPRFRKDRFNGLPIKSVMCAPLRTEGVIMGSILLLNKDHDNEFDESDLSYLEKLAAIAAPFLRNVQKIQEYFAVPLPEAALLAKYENLGLFGKSKKFVELLQAIEAAARCDVRVLLEGQTGTGKELIARAIHAASTRSAGPFVAIDCGAIPENILESEFFGHVKGAFTGATRDRRGLLEEADHGTLFMDEIANLPLEMQAKFMRVLQEGEVRPLGSNKSRKVDVRIISASSESMRMIVDSRKFREDLYYRLHVYPIYVPLLSERPEDIPVLARHLLHRCNRQMRKQITDFSPAAMAMLQQYHWPGNVRELANVIERAMVIATGANITPDLLPLPPSSGEASDEIPIGTSLEEALQKFKKRFIAKNLAHTGNNQSRAAQLLKIQRTYLSRLIKELGLKTKE
jgi:Nif-specific regulatory protein